jgi:LacI family transcriptional regulator
LTLKSRYFTQNDRYFANGSTYCGFDDMIWSQQKGDSFKRTLDKFGFETYVFQQPKAKYLRKADEEQIIIAKWLKPLPKPIALMTCNDDRGIDVLAACKIAKFKVPEQVAILGVDNDELICNFSYPQLSSIALSTKRTGYEAALVLDKLMKKQTITENETDLALS